MTEAGPLPITSQRAMCFNTEAGQQRRQAGYISAAIRRASFWATIILGIGTKNRVRSTSLAYWCGRS